MQVCATGLIMLSRNMGVLQTTVAEIVTVKEHQRKCRSRARSRSKLTLLSSSLCYHAFRLVSWVGLLFHSIAMRINFALKLHSWPSVGRSSGSTIPKFPGLFSTRHPLRPVPFPAPQSRLCSGACIRGFDRNTLPRGDSCGTEVSWRSWA